MTLELPPIGHTLRRKLPLYLLLFCYVHFVVVIFSSEIPADKRRMINVQVNMASPRNKEWSCCFGLHVRTATIIIGTWHLCLNILALSVLTVIVRSPAMVHELHNNGRSDMIPDQEVHPALPTPLSKIETQYREHDLNYRKQSSGETLTHVLLIISIPSPLFLKYRANGHVWPDVPVPHCHLQYACLRCAQGQTLLPVALLLLAVVRLCNYYVSKCFNKSAYYGAFLYIFTIHMDNDISSQCAFMKICAHVVHFHIYF